ncbi:ParB/RepB/Spo0J family partition protein [Sulfurirhabdus autotrophica]|uniref:ParB family chromosome partitioning protein n=1 Tax=Sulfurirhabdus autotrophica TaxID=1706046 RepID=A0A4R3XUS7_9PROT|nr:ParB/RepB/Spo0J family partition protein [Sulfurirhabdus autotrophica]TCV82712.1 ParB family chromosome partitioning protein [Sulfurirhabdus autotrophica]
MKNPVRGIDLSGLDDFDVNSLMTSGKPEHKESLGKPLEIVLDAIIEDPAQPRTENNPGFSEESLKELAASIAQSKGVKVPISVRPVNAEGQYVINHGARRFRASKLANMPTIKAFIDDTHDDYDQAIENIQRENFTPMEIALFIAKRERLNDSRVVIAGRLGKSKGFVTQHAALLTLPDVMRSIYDKGACRDVLALYELNNLHKKMPETVLDFLENNTDISRVAVEALKKAIKETNLSNNEQKLPEVVKSANTEKPSISKTDKADKLTIMVMWKNQLYVLRNDIKPTMNSLGWIEKPGAGKKIEVSLSDLQIDSIIE